MLLFATTTHLRALEQQLSARSGVEAIAGALELAWYLRQSDSVNARAMAESLDAANLPAGLPEDVAHGFLWRAQLIRAESDWLGGQLDAALLTLAPHGEHPPQEAADDLQSDWYNLLARIRWDKGEHIDSEMALGRSIDLASRAGDSLRMQCAVAQLARQSVTRNPHVALAYFERHFNRRHDWAHEVPQLAALALDFLGTHAGILARYEDAVDHLSQAYRAAEACGQRRLAILVASNIGYSLMCLQQPRAALNWLEDALGAAQETGWAPSIGNCLMQIADLARRTGDLDEARRTIEHALTCMGNLRHTRNYAVALSTRAEILFDQGDYAQASAAFRAVQEAPGASDQSDLHALAERGRQAAEAALIHPVADLPTEVKTAASVDSHLS